ncbi:septum site-determining protein MinC [Rhodoferax sediminis]|uniref:Probable septum site-determining protein MinC n=1 Tax=Rhodoferax sediminis TaxID=2509614 RepID=A0A515DGP0_9BURK|nr:septum site-determining protein MinC [Rhodoferax sediminis]QDL39548.1 septum site-determining protein MinC [Rhodoferax sediminis]
MTVALAGRAPATFEIKSANLPLVALLLKSTNLAALSDEMARHYGELPNFFDHDPLVVDLSPLQSTADADDATVDFPALLALLRQYRVMPIAAKGGSAAQMQAAQLAGLAAAPDATMATPSPVRHEAAAPPAPVEVAAPASALVIDKPLRSGQQVYARGRDLVLLCMVNAGAEVIADGHIHVYAPLRGKAIAGARGNADARIFALCMEPELISIAGIYRTSEVALPPDVWSKPTQVRLMGEPGDGKLVMEPIKA